MGEKRHTTVERSASLNSYSKTGLIRVLLVFSGSVNVRKSVSVKFVSKFVLGWFSSKGDCGPMLGMGVDEGGWDIDVSMVTCSIPHNFKNILFSL